MRDLIPMFGNEVEDVSKRIIYKMKQGFELSEMERRIIQTTVECMFVSMQN